MVEGITRHGTLPLCGTFSAHAYDRNDMACAGVVLRRVLYRLGLALGRMDRRQDQDLSRTLDLARNDSLVSGFAGVVEHGKVGAPLPYIHRFRSSI